MGPDASERDNGIEAASKIPAEPVDGKGADQKLRHPVSFAEPGSEAVSISLAETRTPPLHQKSSFSDVCQAVSSVQGCQVRAVGDPDSGEEQASFPMAAAVYFFFLGISSLLPWNFVLSLASYISTAFFDGDERENTLLACFQCGALSVQVVLLKSRLAMKPWNLVVLPAVMAVTAILFAAALTCLPTVTGRVASAHVGTFFFGLASGSQQSCAFSIGSVMPRNCVGLVSVGLGVAGLTSFLVTVFFGYRVFDLNTVAGSSGMVWTSMAVCVAASVSVLIGSWLFLRSPVATGALNKAEQAHRRRAIQQERYLELQKPRKHASEGFRTCGTAEERAAISYSITGMGTEETPQNRQNVAGASAERGEADLVVHEEPDLPEDDLPSRGWREIARDSWIFILCIFFSFFITMNLFPAVGPLRWNYNQSVPCRLLLLIGLFSVGDIIGRCLVDVSALSPRHLGCLVLGKRGLLILVFARLVFYVPFFLGYSLEGIPVLNDFWWYVTLILSLATTQGWVSTVGIVRACNSVVRSSEKEIISPVAVISLQVGIAAGLYAALAYRKTTA